MKFAWDENKAKANLRKHQVTFDEAVEAFADENALDLFDELNSNEEIRYQIIAFSPIRLLFVSYTVLENEDGEITARKASAKQERYYDEWNR